MDLRGWPVSVRRWAPAATSRTAIALVVLAILSCVPGTEVSEVESWHGTAVPAVQMPTAQADADTDTIHAQVVIEYSGSGAYQGDELMGTIALWESDPENGCDIGFLPEDDARCEHTLFGSGLRTRNDDAYHLVLGSLDMFSWGECDLSGRVVPENDTLFWDAALRCGDDGELKYEFRLKEGELADPPDPEPDPNPWLDSLAKLTVEDERAGNSFAGSWTKAVTDSMVRAMPTVSGNEHDEGEEIWDPFECRKWEIEEDGPTYLTLDWRNAEDTAHIDVDRDHVVARAEASQSGLDSADYKAFYRYAGNLVPLRTSTNKVKSAKDAAEWQPDENEGYYAITVIATKLHWNLSVDAEERDSLRVMLERDASREVSCP